MAAVALCQIQITDVAGDANGGFVIRVKGTAQNCQNVDVTSTCASGTAVATVPVAGGSWEAEFAAADKAGCR